MKAGYFKQSWREIPVEDIQLTSVFRHACQCFHSSDRMQEVYLKVLEIGVDRILGDVLGYSAVSWRALTS
jgi:hypothetical protein